MARLSRAVRVSRARVGLSTAAVFPESTAVAFELAASLGYDGVEVMVWTDPISQDPEALRRLSDQHGVSILAIHAPCLLITQRVWTTDPWEKLRRAQAAAELLGAQTVVVHPPFRWQREYSRDFRKGIEQMAHETAVRFAVENMFPLRARGREIVPYAPTWDPTEIDCAHVTLDFSHAAASGSDSLAMAEALGPRLTHVHLTDGTGVQTGPFPDQHLVPGRGSQPCAEVLHRLAADNYPGMVVLEVNPRSLSRDERLADLAESLAFAREHLSHVPAH